MTSIHFLITFALVLLCTGNHIPRIDRIIGGSVADIREHPYQLSLQFRGSHICGATIIASFYALSAAHCVDGYSYVFYSVRANSSTRNIGGQVRQLSAYVLHPDWDIYTMSNDYAILRVASPFSFGIGVQPIVLRGSMVNVGTVLTVTGWGATQTSDSILSNNLMRVDVNVNDWNTCNRQYGNELTNSMMCASSPGRDACQGDSGGPAVATINGTIVLVGVVSWGNGCALTNYPGIYSNVSFALSWIRSTAV